jgi:hypothetical protein
MTRPEPGAVDWRGITLYCAPLDVSFQSLVDQSVAVGPFRGFEIEHDFGAQP